MRLQVIDSQVSSEECLPLSCCQIPNFRKKNVDTKTFGTGVTGGYSPNSTAVLKHDAHLIASHLILFVLNKAHLKKNDRSSLPNMHCK
jgi:hypothetical protein